MSEALFTAGCLPSTGVTRLHRYYAPLRHPLVFGPLPGVTSYRAYLAPAISRRDEEGFSSFLVHPCQHAVGFTPPKRESASVRLRSPLLSSPDFWRLDPRFLKFSRPLLRSLALRPADSQSP